MEFGVAYIYACSAYIGWAYVFSDKLFHRGYSIILCVAWIFWGNDSPLCMVLLAADLILCVVFSPLRPLVWRAGAIKDIDGTERESMEEWLPPMEFGEDQQTHIDVDVVAVHGLASDPTTTWQAPSKASPESPETEKVLWLRDFLPKEKGFKARVLAFHHDSRWLSGASSQTLANHGDDLFDEICRMRTTDEAQNRPLMFIGHSFGGLVIKQMLVNAQMRTEDDSGRLLIKNTQAFVFMGTPHEGANLTTAGEIKGMLNFWEGSSTVFLRFMRPGSQNNRKLHETFMDMLPAICGIRNVFCIWETMPEVYLGFPAAEVVPYESAYIPGSKKLAMRNSHRGMHKINSPKNKTYREIVSFIKRCLPSSEGAANSKAHLQTSSDIIAAPMEQTPKDEKILHSLNFIGMLNCQDRADEKHAGTCAWLPEQDEFKGWVSGRYPILWIRGKPGSGKSTLMSFLAQRFETMPDSTQHTVLRFYFSARTKGLSATTEGLLRSLLYQLYSGNSTVREHMRQDLSTRGVADPANQSKIQWQRSYLEAALFKSIQYLSSSNLIILIDALDEASGDEIKPVTLLLQKIRELGRSSNEVDSTHLAPRICVSCRHYPVVDYIPGAGICVEKHNRSDIVKYLEHHLDRNLLRGGHTLNSEIWKEIKREVIRASSTSFQWASIIADLAPKLVAKGFSIGVLRKRLLELPPELNGLYKRILEEVIDHESWAQALQLFQWVCLAERSLTVREVRYAMAIESAWADDKDQKCHEVEVFVENDERMVLRIVALSGGLLEAVQVYEYGVAKTYVQVSHESVMDFMLESGLSFLIAKTHFPARDTLAVCGLPNKELELNAFNNFSADSYHDLVISASHHRMFAACWAYIVQEEIDVEEDADSSYCRAASNQYAQRILWAKPFLKYAIVFMLHHANKAQRFLRAAACDWDEVTEALADVMDQWIAIYPSAADDSPIASAKEWTILHIAAMFNLEEVSQSVLTTKTCRINQPDFSGHTALHYAASHGYDSLVSLLLNHGADPSAVGSNERTPLIEAASATIYAWPTLHAGAGSMTENHVVRVVQALLDSGANIEHIPRDAGNALLQASRCGHSEVVNVLLARGCNVNAISKPGGTALIAAVHDDHTEIFRMLMDAGADVTIRAGEHETALRAAIEGRRTTMVSTLLDAGAGIHADRISLSYLCRESGAQGFDMVRKLFPIQMSMGMEEVEISDLLVEASGQEEPKMLRYILDEVPQSKLLQRPLDLGLRAAVIKGSEQNVKMLLQAGADTEARDVLKPKTETRDIVKPDPEDLSGDDDMDASLRELFQKVNSLSVQAPLFRIYDRRRDSTALRLAINSCPQRKQRHIVRLLLDAGANIHGSRQSDRHMFVILGDMACREKDPAYRDDLIAIMEMFAKVDTYCINIWNETEWVQRRGLLLPYIVDG